MDCVWPYFRDVEIHLCPYKPIWRIAEEDLREKLKAGTSLYRLELSVPSGFLQEELGSCDPTRAPEQ